MTIYTVRPKSQGENDPKEARLIEAKNVGAVKAHLLEEFEIERATTKETHELGVAGLQIEQAKAG